MLSSIRRTLRELRSNASGNATLLVAAGMPALIGASGLAVDSAQYYMWQRELQFAVDQAALAGAWAKTNSTSTNDYSSRAIQEYNANMQVAGGFDTTPTVTLTAYNGSVINAVQVVSSATKVLPFTNVVTGRSVTVRAEARATFIPGIAGTSVDTITPALSACLVALHPSAAGAFTLGGSATGSIPCGGATLSSDPNSAIQENGNPPAQFGSLSAAGGIDSTLLNNVGGVSSRIKANQTGLTNPFAGISDPVGLGTPRTYACASGVANLQPGTYASINITCNTNFAPGIYVVNGGMDFSNNRVITGSDVMFVLKSNIGIANINSNSAITLSGITKATLMTTYGYSDAASSKLAGMLFWDPLGTSQIKWNGNSVSILNGTMYMPQRQLWFNGTSAVSGKCMMLVGSTLMFTGNLDMSSFCQPAGTTVPSVRPETTVTTTTPATAATVKLIY